MHSASTPTVTGPALDPFTLTVVGPTHPFWVSAHESRNMRDLVLAEITKAGITTGTGSLRYSTETRCRKKRNLKKNSVYLAPASKLAQTTLVLTVTGNNPSEDIADLLVTLSKDNCGILKEHLSPPTHPPAMRSIPLSFQRTPGSTTDTPVCRPAPPPAPAAPTFDDDALYLYLCLIRENGYLITGNTADTLAIRATGNTLIVKAAMDADLLEVPHFNQCAITAKGHALLKRLDSPDDATKPGPSEFDRLKADLIAARSRFTEAKAAHDSRAQALTTLTHQLTQAREAYQSEELNVTTLQSRLQKLQQDLNSAQCKVTGARRHVLDLEEQARALGTDTPDLIQAERTLKEAETAYQQIIAL